MPLNQHSNRTRKHLLGNAGFLFGMSVLVIMLAGAIWGRFFPPYDPVAQDFSNRVQSPSATHLLGTDRFGRDILSRILAGSGPMFIVSAGATLLSLILGIPIGVVSSAAGRFGRVISRLLDAVQAFPGLILSLLLVILLGSTYGAIILAIGLAFFPLVARVTEAVVDSESAREYVQAAYSIGMSPIRVLIFYVLRNGTSTILVQATTIASLATLLEASLSFLGLGPQSITPTWGRMAFDARSTMELAPHTILAPILAISLVVISINLVGDALRDALDPSSPSQR